jgi:hypothetical protein
VALTQAQYEWIDRAQLLNDHAQVTYTEKPWAVLVEFQTQRKSGRWATEAIYAIDADANVIQADAR